MTDPTTFQQVQNGIDTGSGVAIRSSPAICTMAVVFAATRTWTCFSKIFTAYLVL